MSCCTVSKEMISDDQIVMELMNLVIDGKDITVTFEEFPYYLSEKVKILLTSAGYVHLRQHHLSKYTTNISPLSRAILLSGPAEFYHKKLAKALAHYFESKLLFVDINHFSSKYLKRFVPNVSLKRMSGLFGSPSVPSTGTIKDTSRLFFDEKYFIDSLHKVLVSISKSDSVILYLKDVEKIFLHSPRMYYLFQKLLIKFSGSLLILGSRIYDSEDNCINVDEKLTTLFPCNIEIKPPQGEARLRIWKVQLEEAMKKRQLKSKRNQIAEVLAANDIVCDDLNSIGYNDVIHKYTQVLMNNASNRALVFDFWVPCLVLSV